MCDDNIEIGVTEITNNILVSAQPTDQIIDINVTETVEDVTLNITPSLVEVNIDVTQELITEVVTVDANTCVNIVDVTVTDATDNVTLNITPSIVEVNINRGESKFKILEVNSYADLPTIGDKDTYYVTLDTNKLYRWDLTDEVYVEVSAGGAIWGQITGTLSNQTDLWNALNSKQNQLNGIGFVKANGTTISYDNSTYLTTGSASSIYVPYTGAIANVNLGEWGLSSGYISLDNTPTNTPVTAGTLSWNDIDGTADLKLKGGNVTLQIGQEEVVRVVNKTGATLNEADFRAVRIRNVSEGGAQGQRLAVVLAQGNNDTNSATTIGLVTESIANNQEGFITTFGEVKEINTTGAKSFGGAETWVDGDMLYLSPTHAGYLTKVKPSAPEHMVIIGYVVYAHANHGKIFVKVDNGYELDELHNVDINSAANKNILVYNSSTSVWENKLLSYLLSATSPLSLVSNVISIAQANSTTDGYLSLEDWNYFSAKQQALNGTGFIKISGTTISYDNSTYYLASNPNNYISLTALSSVATGLTYTNTTGVFSLTSGYVIPTTSSATNWDTAYTNRITSLTTTGSSGASTLISNVLNIPTYTLTGLGGVPTTRTLTINGTTYDLSADRSWTISTGSGITGSGATGQVTFWTSSSALGGNNNLFWNNSNSRLGIGTTSPSAQLHTTSDIIVGNDLKIGHGTNNIVSNLVVGTNPIFTSGEMNTLVGVQAGLNITTGSYNTAIGTVAGYYNTTNCISIGLYAQPISGSVNSIVIGWQSSLPIDYDFDNATILGHHTTTKTWIRGSITQDFVKNSLVKTDANGKLVAAIAGTDYLGGISATSPLSLTSGVLSITQASASVNGFLSSTDWSTFNAKQTALSGTGFVKVAGTTISYDNTTYTPASRLITINGTSYDLTADRSWTITAGSGMRNVQTFTATSNQTTFTITGGYTAGLIDVYVNGARLSASDYTATNGTSVVLGIGVFANDIVDIVAYTASATSGVSGSGTSGYLAKWSGSTSINGSLIYDDGTNIGIGNASPTAKLHVTGTILASSTVTASSLIRSGGTSAQILAADGSVITAGTNITISGGVISASGGGGSLTGTGTTNYISKWTGSTALGNSLLFDNGTNVGIGTASPVAKFDITGSDANRVVLRVANNNVPNGDKEINMFVGGTSAFGITAWQNSGVIESVAGLNSNFVISNFQVGSIIFTNSGRIERMRIKSTGVINFSSVPTSSAGLSSGDIYKIGGALMIV